MFKIPLRVLTIAYLLSASMVCHASEPNGCGSGWSTKVVPDKIRLLNCSMQSSCNAHDECYSVCEGKTDGMCAYQKCRPKGALYGDPSCSTDVNLLKLAGDAQARRASCDVNISLDIAGSNSGRWACQAVAYIYGKAVKAWGDTAFNGYSNADAPAAWAQTQAEYDQALADFIEFSTEEDFKKFVEQAQGRTPQVNLCGRLKFTKERGLRNVSNADNKPCKIGGV
jgi:hypothetical protein